MRRHHYHDLDIVFVEIYSKDADKYVHESFICVTRKFRNTKSNILRKIEWADAANAGLVTRFQDTSKSGNVSYYKLVNSWAAVNKRARRQDVMVILESAFDSHYFHDLTTTSWWRVVESSSYRFPSDFIFQEKESLISTDEGPG